MKNLRIISVGFVIFLLAFAVSLNAENRQAVLSGDDILLPASQGNVGDKDLSGSGVTDTNVTFYSPGSDQDLEFLIWNNSPDVEWIEEIVITFPDGWEINSISHSAGPTNSGTHAWNMSGEGTNVATWTGSYHYSLSDHWYEVNIYVPSDTDGPQTVIVDIYGDGWGAPPHEVLGIEVVFYQLEENLYFFPYESYGDACAGDSFDIVVTIWNATEDDMEVYFDFDADIGYYASFEPSSIFLDADESADITVTVSTPADAYNEHTEEITIYAYPALDKDIGAEAFIYATTYDDFMVGFVADMNNPRFDAAVVAYDGMVWIFGSQGDPMNRTVEFYDPDTDTWEFGTDIPATYDLGFGNTLSGAVIGDRILLQNPENATWPIYDASDDSWSDTTTPFGGSFAGMLAEYNGLVYFTGGNINDSATNSFYSYDMDTDTWTELTNLPGNRFFHVAFAYDGHIYVAGGYDGANFHSSLFIYSIADEEWNTGVSMPGDFWGGVAAVSGDKAYVAGGGEGNEIWEYDFASETWTNLSHELLAPAFRTGAAVVNGDIYIPGDWGSWGGESYVQILRSCEVLEGPDASIHANDISYSPSNPLPGDTVAITARIHNVGTEDITEGDAEFYYSLEPWEDLQLITIESFGDIPAGDYIDITIDWETDAEMDPRIYIITVMLTDIMPEDINMNNNSAYFELALPVELAYFTATGINNRANIRWKTLSETDNLGFNVYRININHSGNLNAVMPVKINDSLIPGQGTTSGATEYSLTDYGINRLFDYIYILETVSTYGETEEYTTRMMRIGRRQIIF